MRARVTHYDDFSGVGQAICADGRLLTFDIRAWEGAVGPLPGREVILTVKGETIVGIRQPPNPWMFAVATLAIASSFALAIGQLL